MNEPGFFPPVRPVSLAELAAWVNGQVSEAASLLQIRSVAPLDLADTGDLTFVDNAKYVSQLAETRATACLVREALAARVPEAVVPIVVADPYRAWATILGRLYPAALHLEGAYGENGHVSDRAIIHPTARLEPGVTVEPGAVIGARVQIGTGTTIGANAVIGHDVSIGRGCFVGASVTLIHTMVGNRVILHSGVRTGQDGFGFAMGPRGHLKVPQIGRVIIQDDVEIGANTTIDRGANRDTIIGEGTKIDNLVQIGHNVVLGRHCVIVSQVGISGSTTFGDFAVAAGQAGITGHLKIGMGAQIGAQSGVMTDVPAGARVIGSPARPVVQYGRELATLSRLAAKPDKAK